MPLKGPDDVIWDMTYTCPLRCVHCYSESGRRPSRQLAPDDMLRLADAIVSLRPNGVAIAGGEPLTIPGLFDVAERIRAAGLPMAIYTSGWNLKPAMIEPLTTLFSRVVVSLDGGTADVHDAVRGRAGSFDRALDALAQLDAAAERQEAAGQRNFRIGIDLVAIQSNLASIEDLCGSVAPRFPHLDAIYVSAAHPGGLASRADFAAAELLTEEQLASFRNDDLWRRMRAVAPPTVGVGVSDSFLLMMHPDDVATGPAYRVIQVEPDGAARAMAIYEGTVGNLLEEPPTTVWERAVARWSDPFVVETLRPVRTMTEWAAAIRQLDQRFGTAADRERIANRPPYPAPGPDSAKPLSTLPAMASTGQTP